MSPEPAVATVTLETHFWHFIFFNIFMLVMLALDLGLFNRKSHVIKVKEALGWSAFWISLSLCFNVFIYFWMGPVAGGEFLTGYLLEKSLSIDNLFVFSLIFTYFKVPEKYQHKVLFWGVIGALLFRTIFIATGVALIQRFEWTVYIFGAFLIFTGIKMALSKGEEVHPENNPVIKLIKKVMPVTDKYHEDHFFVKEGLRRVATPMFVVLLIIETTDIVFAVDSIPAILAISHDPFIVYTSNVFAIMGLRSLYFALAGILDMFEYLKYGLAAILTFVGVKMVIHEWYEFHIGLSLGVIAGLLTVAIVASILFKKEKAS